MDPRPSEPTRVAAVTVAGPVAGTLARPVVEAVVVARDPGEWFAETLAAWATQEYEPLTLTVVDNASSRLLEPEVAAVLPDARVVRLERPVGFGEALAEAVAGLGRPVDPERPGYLLVAHDDAAPEPGTVEILVEEALAAEAALVGPKIVHWDHTEELEDLGIRVDLFGAKVPIVERGELDQGQHDAMTDVFGVSGPLVLVHRACYDEVGGVDPAIDFHGEDVDLSWRIRTAGGRVRVAPDAVVRHLGGPARRRNPALDERRAARHQLRAALANHGLVNLLLVVPQLIVLSFGEAGYALLGGRPDRIRTVAEAWLWNLRHLPGLLHRRRVLQEARRLSDGEMRFVMAAPQPRWRLFVDHARRVDEPDHDPLASMRSAPVRFGVVAWLVALLLLVLGSRSLIVDGVPAIGRFQPLPAAPMDLMAEWWQGWRAAGVGDAGAAPFGLVLLGVSGRLLDLVGLEGALMTLVVLGALLVGLRGAWRLGRWLGPGLPQAAVLVVYALLPVPYNAIAGGRLDGLVVWTVAPWLLLRLARSQGAPPFPRRRSDPGARPLLFDAALLGFLLAVVAAFSPVVVLGLGALVAGLVIGCLVAGRLAGLHRLVGAAVLAGAIAGALHLPYVVYLLRGGEWAPIVGGGDPRGGPESLAGIIRMSTGPFGSSWASWAVLAVGAGGLFIGRGWRLAWCIRGWFVALVGWGLTWVGVQGWLEVAPPAPEVGTAVAAAGIALAAGATAAAIDLDLREAVAAGTARLGRLVPAATVAALVLLLIPALGAAIDGRWGLPPNDLRGALSFLEQEEGAGAARVLWVGDQDVLPVQGWPLGDGVAYGTSEDGLATLADQWIPPEGTDTRRIADAVRLAAAGGTTRLGEDLAPMAVQYIVVVSRTAVYDADDHPVPEPYRDGIGAQLDLELVPATTSAVVVYRNLAWVPGIADLATGADDIGDPDAVDLSRATPVLDRRTGYTERRGGVVEDATVYHAVSRDDDWVLEVDGAEASPEPALGWAQRFAVPATGEGVLSYRPDGAHRFGAALQLVAFIVLFLGIGSWRTRLERGR